MTGFEWKCEVCGCNMCADSDRKHRLTISYITQKIERLYDLYGHRYILFQGL
jgi:hypothetical protein